MINEEYNETAGVYKVQTFGTTQGKANIVKYILYLLLNYIQLSRV